MFPDRPSDEIVFLKAIAKKLNMEYVDLEMTTADPIALKFVNEKLARMHKIIPINANENELVIAISDPTDLSVLEDIKIISGRRVVPVLAPAQEIQAKIEEFYQTSESAEQAIEDFRNETSDENVKELTDASTVDVDNAPIVRIVNSILTDAIKEHASDIHIEPFEKFIRVRIRIDGDLKEIMQLPKNTLSGIVTRIKIMSDLNIAETKRPQDGRVRLRSSEQTVDMRISMLPTVFGEKTVIRLLNCEAGVMDRSQLGLSPYNAAQLDKLMHISEGIILVTGPTGSGKTTTLYSLLKDLNTPGRNIITLEDPVEYQMYGINQVQVTTKVGMTFASGLRSILRQDPDVIMLGEIRDEETAEIAIRSAVTGHIVLSTLHTNDTASSVTRLIDMGIQNYMVTSAVAGIVAQRLVKRICPKCAEAYEASEQECGILGVERATLSRGRGCSYCRNTGYKGRIAIHEILVLTPPLKSMVNHGCTADELKEAACKSGMQTLAYSARNLVLEGITTVAEMERATYVLE
ncbi:MAG: GspE/PulE family protein [Clostridia bacterium]|nr:GspE/PulE family protein [Clostridia bacterium]